MRDRLIELLRNAPKTDTVYGNIKLPEPVQTLQTIADHLLAAGVIVPPCKAGDTAYHVTSIDTLDELNVAEIFEGKVSSFSIEDEVWIFCRYDNRLNCWYTERDIGKTLFLTKEEAEKALAERREG
jgi:hypothetical protein